MKKIIRNLIIIILIVVVIIKIGYESKKSNKKLDLENQYKEKKEETMMYNSDAQVEDLKKEYNFSGDSNLYEIETEYDGRKVLAIKPNEDYKVAFAGLVKRSKPEKDEVSEIFEKEYPTENGMWIEEKSRYKILKYLNDNLSSKYEINQSGYLKNLDEKDTEKDKQIISLINGDRQYILAIEGTAYYIDPLTGDIIDDIYEQMDEHQTYSYFKNENNMIIYITENKQKALTSEEIFESLLELVKE